MSEGSVEHEPDDWEEYEDLDWRWDRLWMKEIVYSDLPEGAADAIEDFIRVDDCYGSDIERVHRLDPQTIEIVWHDDEGEAPHGKNYYRDHSELTLDDYHREASPTKVANRVVGNVERVIQRLFGEHWRVTRKSDERRGTGEHPQRVLVRRASHQRFKYATEGDSEYLYHLHGPPENAPEGVETFGDLDVYPEPPGLFRNRPKDVYVYVTSTVSVHLIQNVRNKWVFEDPSCECGLTVQAEDVVDGEVIHYAEYLREEADLFEEGHEGDLDPQSVIDSALCMRCWLSYADNVKDLGGNVVDREAPDINYDELIDWDPEVDYGDF